MKYIEHNPYRYLGVYSNSPTKERVANQAKMKAFLKVGKQVSFPLDMPDIIGPINRSQESVADATAKLTLPADQIKYAQFWWMKATPMDDIAFNHLTSGNIEMAKSIWEKNDNTSSLQNRVVLSLIRDDYASAIRYAQTLYNSSSFVSTIVDTGVSLDGTSLAHDFIDALLEDGLDVSTLQTFISDNEWKSYVSEKMVVPLIDSINQAIAIAQSSKGNDPKARYEAGQKLMEATRDTLNQLKSFISATDIRYGTIADKLGIAILQCGIDYYNNSSDDDAAHKAMTLQNYALSIVVGSLAKERCQENVKILNNIIAQLPPAEVMVEYRAIIKELEKYANLPDTINHAKTLLDNTKPHLKSMKDKVGTNNKQYLHWSTIVVSNALNGIIAEVNFVQDIIAKSQQPSLGFKVIMPETLKKAWDCIRIMDKFDIEGDFKNDRYNGNRAILKDLCEKLGINTRGVWGQYGCLFIILAWIVLGCLIGGIVSATGGSFATGFIVSSIITFIGLAILGKFV